MALTLRSRRTIVTCITLAAIAASVIWFYAHSRSWDEIAAAKPITFSTDRPAEDKPDTGFEWPGGASDPKKLTIESAGIDGFIQNVSVDQHGAVAVPNNIYIAGWFVKSVPPGQPGLSIIDGHVNGRSKDDGIFKQLPSVSKGDVLSVEFGDGSTKRFKVIDTKEVATEDSASVLFSQDPGTKSQLNLITCTGNFDANARSYDKRFIVMAATI